MSDVLFVVHDRYQEDNQFPLGIAYLSSILEDNGYSVEVYCMDVLHYTNEDLAKKLDNNEYKIIGVGFLAARFKETVIDLCRTINKHKKDAWLILGGHCSSPIPTYMLDTVHCDAVVVGEAEQTILEVMKNRLNGTNKRIYRGIPVKHIDDISYPSWHLFPMDKYVGSMHWNGGKSMQLISSRGCIGKCTFCMRLEKGLRLRSMDNLMDEMNILHDRYGVNNFQFQDELFLISKKRIEAFNKAVRQNGLDISYTANARVDILTESVAQTIKDGGCILLNIGFESSSQEVLDYMKKNVTVEQNINALEVLKKARLSSGLNFIWGFPPDNRKTLTNNVKLIKKYNPYFQCRSIRPVTSYPGCELYYEAINKGLLSGPEDFFNRFKNSDCITVNFMKMSDEEAYKCLFKANKELILDHQQHTNMTIEEAEYIIDSFYKLYFINHSYVFRGVRHYKKVSRQNKKVE